MTHEHIQPPLAERARAVTEGDSSFPPGASVTRRLAGSQNTTAPAPVKQRGRALFVFVVLVLTVGLAAVWTFVAQRQLRASIVDETTQHLEIGRKAFETLRAQTQASLQSHCRVLVEDPRLKATLATEGMDAATVADILKDLGELRRAGFLMVLSPEGRVFAEAGAPELRGIDLSASSVVKKASATNEAVGSWVLAGKVMDLSVMTIRYGESVVAYLVVGQPVDDRLMRAVADQSGVAVASALANTVGISSSNELAPLFARIAAEPGGFQGRLMTTNGTEYVTSAVELAETAQAHRLLLVASVSSAAQKFETVKWMIFAAPLLVLIAVLFSMTGLRAPRRT